ncbi:MAG: hypothetical protein ABIZ52_06940 [Candidatus Limnocylindrales bacterium]
MSIGALRHYAELRAQRGSQMTGTFRPRWKRWRAPRHRELIEQDLNSLQI